MTSKKSGIPCPAPLDTVSPLREVKGPGTTNPSSRGRQPGSRSNGNSPRRPR